MNELIKELKNNKKVNEQKGLENIVNIDYIIERLENINIFDEFIQNEIVFNIENIVNDISNWQEDADTTKEVEDLKDEDIKEIGLNISCNDFIINYIHDILYETIQDVLYEYINKKEVK